MNDGALPLGLYSRRDLPAGRHENAEICLARHSLTYEFHATSNEAVCVSKDSP